MAQLVARVDDELVLAVDTLVREGVVASRSEAVRVALELLTEQHRRRKVGEAIVAAYSRQPQMDEDLAGLDQATRAMVMEEPW